MEEYKKYLPIPFNYNYVTEVWLPVRGYEEKYLVSSLGRIKTLNFHNTGVEFILKPTKDKLGYYSINLRKNGKSKCHLISRLVCEAFHGLPDGYEADHINWVPEDNRFINLQPLPKAENIKRCSDKGREARSRAASKTIKMVNEKYKGKNKKKVYQYDLQGNFIKEWGSLKEAAETLKIQVSHISLCCKDERRTAGEFVWRDYKADHIMIREKKRRTGTPVLQLDMNGQFVKWWSSAREAAIELGINKGNISSCCKGKGRYKSAGGFIWRYAKKEEV